MTAYQKLLRAGYEVVDGFGSKEEAKRLSAKLRVEGKKAQVIKGFGGEWTVYAKA